MLWRTLMAAALAGSVAIPNAGAQSLKPITTMDLLNIKQITDVKITRDGSLAVYTLKSIVREGESDNGLEKYDYHTHLWMVSLDEVGAEPTQLTFGDRDDSSIAISPDGSRVAFVRQPLKKEGEKERSKPQVWLLSLGAPGEAQQITTLEFGASSPEWRPDGSALLVSSAILFSKIEGTPSWDQERPMRTWDDAQAPADTDKTEKNDEASDSPGPGGDRQSIRDWLARNGSKGNPVVMNRLAFQDERTLKGEEKFAHLFLIDLNDDNRAAQLTDGFHNHSSASFSPNGRTIVFVDKPRTSEHPDRFRRTVIYQMNADGSNVRALLDDAEWSYGSPRFAPDGKFLYCTQTQQDELLYRQARLRKFPLGRISFNWREPDWRSAVTNPIVTRAGVYFTSPWQGGFPLLKTYSRIEPVHVIDGPVGVHVYDAAGDRVVAAITSVDNPSELFVVDTPGDSPRQLTHHNSDWLSHRALSKPTEHWLTRPDGERIQYWVMEPTNRKPGEKYPVVLEIHGGPMSMWGPGEFTMWHEFQLLTSWGYGVVYSNPRGSSGYGFEFQRDNHRNWGDGPTGDVLACLDEALADNKWMDAERQFVTGGSYAGYLTAWIIGHSDRFKAAVAQRGVYDLATFFGEGNAWQLVEHAMGGFPWEPETRKILQHESPFTYVDRINTPFLIMHGSSDLRTGTTESEMMYRALKELRKEVEYIRYPGAGHDLSRTGDPLQRLDRLSRIVEFFERYSHNDRPAPTTND